MGIRGPEKFVHCSQQTSALRPLSFA